MADVRTNPGKDILSLYPEIRQRGNDHYYQEVIKFQKTVCLSPYFHHFFLPIIIRVANDNLKMYQKVKIVPVDLNGEMYAMVLIEDMTESILHENEMKDLNRQLTAEVEEKKILLREVHHRVKNNLQIICSLIRQQLNSSADPVVNNALNDSLSRIMSISLVHEELYNSGSLANIDFGQFVSRMIQHLFDAHGVSRQRVGFFFECSVPPLSIGQALPCALITNELITNALKYAFPSTLSRHKCWSLTRYFT